MSNVKKIKVGSTSYDCKDATARTQVGRINLTKSGNNLVFTDSNGTQHTITPPSAVIPYEHLVATSIGTSEIVRYINLKTGETKSTTNVNEGITTNAGKHIYYYGGSTYFGGNVSGIIPRHQNNPEFNGSSISGTDVFIFNYT